MAELNESFTSPAPTRPIFQSIFGADWARLPTVMKRHYAIRPASDDSITVEGQLDIEMITPVSLMARLTGLLVPYQGQAVPVTVTFSSDRDRTGFRFERVFDYPDKPRIRFRSVMEPVGGNELIEFMRFGLGWKAAYHWDGSKVILRHRGYVLRLFGRILPLPLEPILGRGHAEETPLSDDSFSMWTHTIHPLFGKTFGYRGRFRIAAMSCPEPS